MNLSRYQWQTYTCESCGSLFNGRVFLLGAFDLFYIELLDRKTYPQMCPICGRWQDTPKGN